jgi:SWIM zinc finger
MIGFPEMGRISFRTKCLTIERAGAFARALNANSRFTDVEIRESKKAKGDVRWFVCFLPSSPARQAAMLEREQSAREDRAATQAFTVVKDPDHDYHHVYSHQSQECYEVSVPAATCDCPDFRYRANGSFLCKHLIACASAIRRGEVGTFEAVPAPRISAGDMSWAKDQALFEQVFG